MADKLESRFPAWGRWAPFSDPDQFDPFATAFRATRPLGDVFAEGPASRAFMPSVDVSENDCEYIITAEIPGMSKDDVTVELHDRVLTLRGEKRNESQNQKDHVCYFERRFGRFSRSFSLPSNADAEKLLASFKDGVLNIRLPKQEKAKPMTVPIHTK